MEQYPSENNQVFYAGCQPQYSVEYLFVVELVKFST